MTVTSRPGLTARILPILAISLFIVTVLAIIWSAGSTLGYDFQAYVGAARRLIAGQPLYDPAIDVAGGFAIYLYPPPFAVAIVPLAWIGGQTAVWIWVGLMIAAFLAGIALMPVRSAVRWAILLLGALDWPVLYSIKLGQVGPLLLLLFAVGWRAVGTPLRPCPPWGRIVLGASIALGALIKVQPALLLGWAALTGRWRSIAVAIGVGMIAVLGATLVAGTQPWFDYPALLGRVSSPLTTPHNFTPGAIAFQAGIPESIAAAIQWASVAATLMIAVVVARIRSAEASYLVTVVASQLISPLLWDHYAMLLLLPVAWLLERRQWWALAIPLATSIAVVGIMPSATYPVVFGIGLIGPLLVSGWLPPAVGEPRSVSGDPPPTVDEPAPATDRPMTLDSGL